MIPLDNVTKENIKKHNPNWPQIPYHPYRKLIIGDSGSGKINSLFNLINQQPDIDKIYLYYKDPHEEKHRFLTNKQKCASFKLSKSFMEYLNDMEESYKNIEEYNPNKKCKTLIVFDYVIADILS